MASDMNDVPESPEERLSRRRSRRWKRRARIAGPFLGIPILLVTLTLSVDLIEYDPQPERPNDRPIPVAVIEKAQDRTLHSEATVSSTSVASTTTAAAAQNSVPDVALAGDTPLVGGSQFAAPMPRYSMPNAR